MATTTAPMIAFRDVGKTYPKTTAPVMSGVDLEIERGELVALIGPSGCGKSTLLNLLAGLTDATTGTIDVAGSAGTEDLRSAYVFQNPRLLPWRSVRHNVEFGLEQAGVPGAERRRRATEALELVHLGEHGDKYPHQLSGGMQQRAALARGLALEPDLLLLDEPFGALDALTRSYLQEELLSIVRRFGTTTLLVTHDIDEALLLADRIVVMSSRPARIKRVVTVPFGRERALDSVLAHPQFVPLRHEIRELLRPEVAASDPAVEAGTPEVLSS
ncbi:ABC transporter ATP-binding protein [Nocardioides zeae]